MPPAFLTMPSQKSGKPAEVPTLAPLSSVGAGSASPVTQRAPGSHGCCYPCACILPQQQGQTQGHRAPRDVVGGKAWRDLTCPYCCLFTCCRSPLCDLSPAKARKGLPAPFHFLLRFPVVQSPPASRVVLPPASLSYDRIKDCPSPSPPSP